MTSINFQSRATEEGRTAQDIAGKVIDGCGFTKIRPNVRRAELGVTINFIATDARGRDWHFDVAGSFTSHRAGLLRTDTVWKALGRASVLSQNGIDRIILLTTNLPRRESGGDRALRATRGRTFFDAVEMLTSDGKLRLRSYARGDAGTRPLPGFWSSAELYGERLNVMNALGAQLSIPLAETGDPFGCLTSDPKVTSMSHRLKVFMPSQAANGCALQETLRREVLKKTQQELAALGGGFTSYDAQGHWVDPMDGIADERVNVLEVYSREQPTQALIRNIVDRILQDLDQEAVAIILDDRMYQFRR